MTLSCCHFVTKRSGPCLQACAGARHVASGASKCLCHRLALSANSLKLGACSARTSACEGGQASNAYVKRSGQHCKRCTELHGQRVDANTSSAQEGLTDPGSCSPAPDQVLHQSLPPPFGGARHAASIAPPRWRLHGRGQHAVGKQCCSRNSPGQASTMLGSQLVLNARSRSQPA